MIEKLFTEKLKPAVAEELERRDEIAGTLRQIEADRLTFTAKIEAAGKIITDLEGQIDARIIGGKSADDLLNKLSAKRAEVEAYNRQIQRLTDAEVENVIALRTANERLSIGLGSEIDGLRAPVQALIENAMLEVLRICVSFENAGHAAEKAYGVDLEKRRDLAVYRFPGLYEGIFRDLEAYLSPIGEDLSAIRRREVRELWAAREAAKEKQAA